MPVGFTYGAESTSVGSKSDSASTSFAMARERPLMISQPDGVCLRELGGVSDGVSGVGDACGERGRQPAGRHTLAFEVVRQFLLQGAQRQPVLGARNMLCYNLFGAFAGRGVCGYAPSRDGSLRLS